MTTATRVLIADDHAPARAGIRLALEDGGFVVCAEAATASAAVTAAMATRPDACVLDVRMPGGGIEAAARIRSLLPQCAVVMLTMSREDEDLFAALRVGAAGYLLKDIDPSRLPLALRGVLAGEAALPRDLTRHLLDELRTSGWVPGGAMRPEGDPLTARERDVLELLCLSHGTASIAAELFVSTATVRTHVSAILRKLHAVDRDEAVRLATRGRARDDRSQPVRWSDLTGGG